MIIATILSIVSGGSLAYIVVRLLLDSIEIKRACRIFACGGYRHHRLCRELGIPKRA